MMPTTDLYVFPYPIPLGLPSAPGLSTCLMLRLWARPFIFYKNELQELKWEKDAASGRYRQFHSAKLSFIKKFLFWIS